jgi:hypothetical protein
MARVQSRSNKIAHGHVLKTCSTSVLLPRRTAQFQSRRRIPLTVLNKFKLFPRFRDYGVIINTLL